METVALTSPCFIFYYGVYLCSLPSLAGKKLTVQNSNWFESALGEAVFMTGLEWNGDVVEMASYAPLLNLVGSEHWYTK